MNDRKMSLLRALVASYQRTGLVCTHAEVRRLSSELGLTVNEALHLDCPRKWNGCDVCIRNRAKRAGPLKRGR